MSVFFALALAVNQANSIRMELLPSGAFARIGGYAPIGIHLSDRRPASLTKAPSFAAPKFGQVHFGGRTYAVVVDGTKLYVDSNGNGDLTDDPSTAWEEKTVTSYGVPKKEWSGFATIDLPYNGKVVACRIGIYSVGTPDSLGCYVDFGLTGTVTLCGVTYPAIISDTSGEFSSAAAKDRNSILMIDLDHTGRYNPGYEFFPISQPFNIGGATYEVRGQGAGLSIVKSKFTVAERSRNVTPPDPNLANGLRVGVSAPKFTATTIGGRSVAFPATYSGKVVMIDFWATWCGPCMREVPNVAKAYAKFHTAGLEILGISLDQENALDRVKGVTTKNGMTWDQIYDGKYWQSTIAQRYKIKAIPATYLVDGNTGKVMAFGEALRGENLGRTLARILGAKAAK